jgi:hypothetical protein
MNTIMLNLCAKTEKAKRLHRNLKTKNSIDALNIWLKNVFEDLQNF